MRDYTVSNSLNHVSDEDLVGMQNGDVFLARINLALEQGTQFVCPNGPIDIPDYLQTKNRLHINLEMSQFSSFELDACTQAFTSVSDSAKKQFTMVTRKQEDGSREFWFTVSDAKPPRTRV